MGKSNKEKLEESLARITEVFAEIIAHTNVQTAERCPYKNRFSECTARFGCRNQRKPRPGGELFMCGGDDKLDYRSAWETEKGNTTEG